LVWRLGGIFFWKGKKKEKTQKLTTNSPIQGAKSGGRLPKPSCPIWVKEPKKSKGGGRTDPGIPAQKKNRKKPVKKMTKERSQGPEWINRGTGEGARGNG